MITFGIADICDRYAVGEHTVLGWIKNGELKAVNVSRRQSGRPRWRITQEALDAFEMRRTPTPLPPRTKAKRQTNNQTIYYK